MLGRGCLSDQPLPEASGPDCGGVFVIDIFHTVKFDARGVKCGLCDITGKNSWQPAPSFLGVSPRLPFPSADSAREALANLNLSQEYV